MRKSKEALGVSSGRVLGRVLSREEISSVSGGVEAKPKTDSWKDQGTCTPQSDNGKVADSVTE